jgi:Uma2 family endonuclease
MNCVLRLPDSPRRGANWFYRFCRANDDWRLEQTATGEIVVMEPLGLDSADRAVSALVQLRVWAQRDGSGNALTNVGFQLRNGATRAPTASWTTRSRLARLTPRQRPFFPPLCPDFVIEILSPSDDLRTLQAKMVEYIKNGARLGWLIDPRERSVYLYRPRKAVARLKNPKRLSGDPELPGFVFDLKEIWEPGS